MRALPSILGRVVVVFTLKNILSTLRNSVAYSEPGLFFLSERDTKFRDYKLSYVYHQIANERNIGKN